MTDALHQARTAAERRDAAQEAAHLIRALDTALGLAYPDPEERPHRAQTMLETLERIRFSERDEDPHRAGVEALIEGLRSR